MFRLIFIFLISNLVQAQSGKTIEIRFNRQNVEGNYALIYNGKTLSNDFFMEKILLNTAKTKGILSLKIKPDIYEEIQFVFSLDSLPKFKIIKIELTEKSKLLDEVIISSKKNRFRKNGDTTFVNLEDLETRPHADASAIFEVLEGFDVSENGIYKALGGKVEIVTIDGNKIFGGNPHLTISNIKADMISSFEITNRRLANGSSKKIINIKLKENRKKGFFGNLGLGLGNKANDFDFKANKIDKKGIVINFGSINNTSLITSKIPEDEDTKYDFFMKYTFFGIQNYTFNLNEDSEELNLGINQNYKLGSNLNFENKKVSQSFVVLANQRDRKFGSESLGETQIGPENLLSYNSSFGNSKLRTINTNYTAKGIILKKINSFLKVSFEQSESKSKQKDSIYFGTNESISQKFFRKENIDQKVLQGELGLAFTHKNKRIKTLFYSNFSYRNHLSNTSQDKFQAFIQDRSTNNLNFELSHSYPISKRVLVEHRPSFSLNTGINQTVYIQPKVIKTQQNVFKIDNHFYYQAGVFLLTSSLTYFNFLVSNKLTSKTSISQLNIKFPKNNLLSDFNFNYQNKLEMPLLLDVFAIADSTNFFSRKIGNQNLSPFFKRIFRIDYTNQNSPLFNLTSSLSFNESKNSFQNETNFGEYNSFIQKISNFEQRLFGLSNNTFVIFQKLPKRVEINLSNQFDIQQTAFLINNIQNQGTNLMNNLSLQIVYKKSHQFVLKNNFNHNYYQFQNQQNNQFENRTNIQISHNKKTYSKLTSKIFFGSGLNLQPIINLEVQRYLTKQNKISVELKAFNVFNIGNSTVLNQQINQQFLNNTLQLPRLILVKINLYPEKWKAKKSK